MVRSDPTTKAQQILDRIRALLDPEKVEREILCPVDHVLEFVSCEKPVVDSQPTFHQAIGDFVRALHKDGLRVPRILSSSDALAEAISILDQGKPSMSATGYAAALLEGTQGEEGIARVFLRIAELVKERQVQQYVAWAFGAVQAEADWQVLCSLSAILANDLSPYLTPDAVALSPTQLAAHWQDLLTLYLKAHGSFDYYPSEPNNSPCA